MSKDIGNKCVECLKDTSFGSGRFVNRIPADNGIYDGYQCADCQMIECDDCKEKTLDYFICNETASVYCDDCNKERRINDTIRFRI
tara:strand:- start:2384 stop:2641 length:258 start_codon:yes stop_codon:yes gene_type:complete